MTGAVEHYPGTFGDRVAAGLADSGQRSALRDYQDEIQPYARELKADLPQWQDWRDRVRDVRAHTLRHLDYYLGQFIDNVERRGGTVFVAATAAEARAYVADLASARGVRQVVKSKTMLGEEIGINRALEDAGVAVVETDLGEYIIQLAGERPAHITGPCLHMTLEDVHGLLCGVAGRELPAAPEALTAYARAALRDRFLAADMGITGCNFGVARSGSVVLVTNEGNARMVTTLPPLHVALVGIERLVPDWDSLDALLTVLPRAGVCGVSTSYVTAITGPRGADEPDGARELHVVVVDNGRSGLLGTEYEQALWCIRCGSCIDHCPVWRHIGGQAYGSPYSGPIGAVITPLLGGLREWRELPFASSLCGACAEVCPARVPLPDLLLALRCDAARMGLQPRGWREGMWAFGALAEHPRVWTGLVAAAGKLRALGRSSRLLSSLPGPLRGWARSRDVPLPAARSFSSQWRRRARSAAPPTEGGDHGS